MHERILKRIRQRIVERAYVMTVHADEEMDSEGLSIRQVEESILNGRITRRQPDIGTAEWKYCVRGASEDRIIETICKPAHGGNLIVITLYTED